MRCDIFAVVVVGGSHGEVLKDGSAYTWKGTGRCSRLGLWAATEVCSSGYLAGWKNVCTKSADSTDMKSSVLRLVSNDAPCLQV